MPMATINFLFQCCLTFSKSSIKTQKILHSTYMLQSFQFSLQSYFYGVALAAITRQIPNRSYILLVMLICDILGALASSLLILILLSFGQFLLVLCAFVLSLKALHGSNWKIFELLPVSSIQHINPTFFQTTSSSI
jgi:hypothetical protein